MKNIIIEKAQEGIDVVDENLIKKKMRLVMMVKKFLVLKLHTLRILLDFYT